MGLFPEWTWIVGLWIGAAIGSFLNVVIYRMPRGLSLGHPTYSFCPICKHRLHLADLLPLLSWLLQKGRCRYCDVKIHPRYFFVELINGIIWAALWQSHFIDGNDVVKFSVYALASSALVAIIYIDLELQIIPEQINAFLSLLGLSYGFYLVYQKDTSAWMWGMPSTIAGWIVGVGVLWIIAILGRLIFGRMAMGEGDIKMTRGIGALLFPLLAGVSIGIAVLLGAVIGSVQAYLSSRNRKAPVGDDVPVMVEGALTNRSDQLVSVKVTDTTQAAMIAIGTTAEFVIPEAVEYWKGNKRIEQNSFWEGLPMLSSVSIEAKQQDGKFVVTAIGRDQAHLFGLIKAGVGYMLGLDIIGLFYVPLYKKYFGEDPYEVPADLETFDAGPTMIPFGPYLAVGAIIAAVFAPQLVQVIQNYLNWAGIGKISLEHGAHLSCLKILG